MKKANFEKLEVSKLIKINKKQQKIRKKSLSCKGQASLEYLATYTWALIAMVGFIGVMFYFDLFNIEKYAAQYCVFDSNYYCHDYTIQKDPSQASRFNMNILIQNNMDKEIIINQTRLIDNNGAEINCQELEIFCRHDNPNPYMRATPSNAITSIVDVGMWDSTMVCRLYFRECNSFTYVGDKKEVNIELTFSRVARNTTHLSYGVVYANVI